MEEKGVTKVELFEHIRKDYYLSKKSKRSIAKKYKTHRRTVRQALVDPIPPVRQISDGYCAVLTPEVKRAIDEWLLSDQDAPIKQRHTALRIYTRLIEEYQFKGKLPTIKRHVGERRRKLGLKQKGFIPLAYEAGMEAEVDWYECYVNFAWGQKERVYIFQMRACYSGKEFHMAFAKCNQQTFLEAHVHAFNYFGGVFKKIRYDNLKLAVTKVLRGRQRKETEQFILLRSHYLFEAVYCKPGKEGAHEKGGVECSVGRFRRQHLVPVPSFMNYQELNQYLVTSCQQDDKRKIEGKITTIIDDWQKECNQLLALPKYSFDFNEVRKCRVNSRSLITLGTHRYSVPTYLIDQEITVKLSSHELNCYHQGHLVATHSLCYKPYEIRTKLDHYLELLWQKPGALANALPLKQAKENNHWPNCYDELWKQLINRYGQFEGTRQLIELLFLHRTYSRLEIKKGIEEALLIGWYSFEGVRQLICFSNKELQTFFNTCQLSGFHRPQSESTLYDILLTQGETA